MKKSEFEQQSIQFSRFLQSWRQKLPTFSWQQAAPDPARTAILSVDLIEGFCTAGPLASPRVKAIVEPCVRAYREGYAHGIRALLLLKDTHEPDAVEFNSWPPHCVRGTVEAEPVAAIKALPFFSEIDVIEKNSISSGLHTGLNDWLAERPQLDTFLVLGDCTDLCTYQLAMHLRLDANARQLRRRVIVPADCADTYDTPFELAEQLGILPHPGDFIHIYSLYHLALNGIEVAASVRD